MSWNNDYLLISICLVSCLVLLSCQKEDADQVSHYTTEEYQQLSERFDLPITPFDYSLGIPKHLFRGSTNRVNMGNDDKATLGRVLFYDTRLSATNEVSCGSCHKQEFAFADNVDLSAGVRQLKTKRNSISLAATPSLIASYSSAASFSAFGWDHAHEDSQSQSLAALLNSNEMGNANLSFVLKNLTEDPAIEILTEKAFGDASLTDQRLLESIDAFMNSIGAFNTRFDEAIESNELFSGSGFISSFTDQENTGKNIYMTHCASCHGVKFDIQLKQIANNGLSLSYKDKGVGHLKGKEFNGHFKVPFLRNVAVTGPYMHDGRFKTLREVVDHYSENIQAHPNLSFELQETATSPKTFNFSKDQKEALIAFMETLTDETVLASEKYSDPFLQ